MSFRKRSVPLSSSSSSSSSSPPPDANPTLPTPGIRPSPIDGRPTTSTGTATLDALFSGHGGLPTGSSLLVEESGTTDFAGALLRFYAAEGVVQGQQVHVVGVGEGWGRELPGLVGEKEGGGAMVGKEEQRERMRIAWRYERLGEFGGEASGRAPTPQRGPVPSSDTPVSSASSSPFCHSFDLTKRLIPPQASPAIIYHPLPPSLANPFTSLITSFTASISSTPIPHRIVIPSMLSTLIYSPQLSHPHTLLPFLHSLRSLLRRFPHRLTILITLPLSLYPRPTGLVRWIEQLCDGVIELAPFPHNYSLDTGGEGRKVGKDDEKPQGLVRVERLPVATERGQGGGRGEDRAFWVSRRRFVIKPFSLPPVEGDREAQDRGGGEAKELEF